MKDEVFYNGYGTFSFDQDVTNAFEDMLQRSIPQYDQMREATFAVADHFVMSRGDTNWVIDLGASRGGSIEKLLYKYGANLRYLLVETSEPMLEVLRDRFVDYVAPGIIQIRSNDLRVPPFPTRPACVIQSVLTLQFIAINYRQAIIQRIYDSLEPGGAFILVEKLLAESWQLDSAFTRIYHNLKHRQGYTQEAIDRKAHALEGVLVPTTASWNIDLMRQAGFREIDCFWRYMNFAGFVAIK